MREPCHGNHGWCIVAQGVLAAWVEFVIGFIILGNTILTYDLNNGPLAASVMGVLVIGGGFAALLFSGIRFVIHHD